MQMENGTIRHRRRSLNIPGHAHEFTFSCYRRFPLLSTDRSRSWLINSLDRARRIHGYQIFAYVIMPDHVHLLTLPQRSAYRVSDFLKSAKQPVARRAMNYLVEEGNVNWLERLTARQPRGKVERHFWQPGGGYDRNIVSRDAFLAAIAYIHANPVRAGLVENPTDFEWSSAKWWEGERDVKLAMDAETLW